MNGSLDDRILTDEPLTRYRRLIEDPMPAGAIHVRSHPIQPVDPALAAKGLRWRPYLENWSFRVAGLPLPGVTQPVIIAFRRYDRPAIGTPLAQLIALATDPNQVVVYYSPAIWAASFFGDNPRGLPIPIDDGAPWVLWIGTVGLFDSEATFQIGFHPIRLGGC